MNKFKEALHRVCWGCDEYSKGACEHDHCAVYVPIKELIDEQEKYRWHDLRKDPNDLPKENTRVLVIYKFWESRPSYTVARLAKRTYANVWIENGNAEFSSGMVFAWKYIKGLEE